MFGGGGTPAPGGGGIPIPGGGGIPIPGGGGIPIPGGGGGAYVLTLTLFISASNSRLAKSSYSY